MGIANQNQVQPSTATPPACCDAKFPPFALQQITSFLENKRMCYIFKYNTQVLPPDSSSKHTLTQTHIILLSRECSHSHPGGVGLHHSIHTANMRRRDSKACANASDGTVWWGHKWVSPWERWKHPMLRRHLYHSHCQIQIPLSSRSKHFKSTPVDLPVYAGLPFIPKSISSKAALAPSTRIFLLGPVRALCMK